MKKSGRLVRSVAFVAVIASAVGALGAAASGSARSAPTQKTDPKGILKLAQSSSTALAQDFWLPWGIGAVSFNLGQYQRLVYGSLFTKQLDGSYKPSLATGYKIVDDQTVDLTLRSGVQYSDGTPFNAESVKYAFDQVIAHAQSSFAYSPESKLLTSATVTGPLAVELKFSKPVASWLFSAGRSFFSNGETFMFSPTAAQLPGGLQANPVGAGPYTLTDFNTSNNTFTMKKNPKYWDAKNVKNGGIESVSIQPGTSQILAAKSNTVDWSYFQQVSAISQLKGTPNLKVDSQVNGGQYWYMGICKSVAPFDDLKVRQALAYATDKVALNKLIFENAGEPATGGMSKEAQFNDPKLDNYIKYNPTKAKQLLKEAGVPDLSFTLLYTSNLVPSADVFSALQQQYKKSGITVTPFASQDLVKDFYTAKPGANASVSVTLSIDWVFSGIGNVCNYQDPKLTSLLDQLAASKQDSKEQHDLYSQYQKYMLDIGYMVPLVYIPDIYAYNSSKIGNAKYMLLGFAGPRQVQYEYLTVSK